MAPATKCPSCANDVPFGDSIDGGYRYHCTRCGNRFEVRSVAAFPPADAAPANPYSPAPVGDAQPIAASTGHEIICRLCGKRNPSRYQFCLGCGGDLHGFGAKPTAIVPTRPAGRPRPILFGSILVGILGFVFMMTSPKSCGAFGTLAAEDQALEAVRACKKAKKVLGDDIAPAWVGCTTGQSKSGGGSGAAAWNTRISGSKSSGDLTWTAFEQNDKWELSTAMLRADGEEINVKTCAEIEKAK